MNKKTKNEIDNIISDALLHTGDKYHLLNIYNFDIQNIFIHNGYIIATDGAKLLKSTKQYDIEDGSLSKIKSSTKFKYSSHSLYYQKEYKKPNLESSFPFDLNDIICDYNLYNIFNNINSYKYYKFSNYKRKNVIVYGGNKINEKEKIFSFYLDKQVDLTFYATQFVVDKPLQGLYIGCENDGITLFYELANVRILPVTN